MDWNIVTEILLITLLIIAFILLFVTLKGERKVKDPLYGPQYKVKIHFAHGIKYKMILNAEQYEQLVEFLKQVDGYFEIGDEINNVKIYRDLICLVEVIKK